MTDELKPEPKKRARTAVSKPRAKKEKIVVDPIGDEAEVEAKTAVKPKTRAKAKKQPAAKPKVKPAAKVKLQVEAVEAEVVSKPAPEPERAVEVEAAPVAEEQREYEIEDDEESGVEAGTDAEPENEPEDEDEPEDQDEPEDDDEPVSGPRPPAKLDRLQKILAAAGIASRRKAEEMIEQGRVQVNGKVVSKLGAKADAGRDHIRVDGKLLHGAERLRYFVLNKPKGFVTTVKDPEGRATVMQFFAKMPERLYPVGRLDYMSEGLLLVTNDGELANRLTRAAAGVEKTYLVKVAGQPTEEELDRLRGGVTIERGKPGEGRVRTSPARIRQVRQGDNPWYEVVLIEGRNRELRKMFEAVGHFVEKIRRVGYGPLVLDVEPGNLRELDPGELAALRDVAEGKKRTPKTKEIRRRNAADAGSFAPARPQLRNYGPPEKTVDSRPVRSRPIFDRSASAPAGQGDLRPKKPFGGERDNRRDAGRSGDRGARPAGRFGGDSRRQGSAPESRGRFDRPAQGGAPGRFERPSRPASDRPASDRPYRPGSGSRPGFGSRPSSGARPGFGARPGSGSRPASGRPSSGSRPGFGSRPSSGPRTFEPRTGSGYRPTPGGKRPFSGSGEGSRPSRPYSPRPEGGSPRPYSPRPEGGSAPRSPRPYSPRPEGGSSRPYSPRPGVGSTSRPAGPKKFGDRPARPSGPRSGGEGFARKSGSGWKPTGRSGGPGKPSFGGRPQSRPGGGSGFRGKPSGGRPGGKRRD